VTDRTRTEPDLHDSPNRTVPNRTFNDDGFDSHLQFYTPPTAKSRQSGPRPTFEGEVGADEALREAVGEPQVVEDVEVVGRRRGDGRQLVDVDTRRPDADRRQTDATGADPRRLGLRRRPVGRRPVDDDYRPVRNVAPVSAARRVHARPQHLQRAGQVPVPVVELYFSIFAHTRAGW